MTTTVTVTASRPGREVLAVEGAFDHPHWLAHLGAGLAEEQVSLLSGSAVRRPDRSWTARFELDTTRARTPVGALDLLAMAARRPARSAAPPVLISSTLTRRLDGLLGLEVAAVDELGFLARLLGRTALLTVLPVELELSTTGGRVADRLVLGGIGGGPPAVEVETALGQMLDGFHVV